MAFIKLTRNNAAYHVNVDQIISVAPYSSGSRIVFAVKDERGVYARQVAEPPDQVMKLIEDAS